MASSRVGEREAQLEPSRSAATYPDCDHKYSLLIIIGQISFPSQAEHVAQEIERGVRSWDVDLTSCNLDLHLRDFLKHHSNSISKKGTGQKCLWYSSGVFDIQVLIRSSQERVYSEVCGLLTSPSGKKLLVLAGQSVDGSGDLLLDRGLFSPHHLTHILTEQFVDQRNDTVPALSTSKPSLTLSCPNTGQWRPLLENQPLHTPLTLHINPPMVFPAMDTLGELTSLLSDSLSPLSPFDLLPPPGTVGFLKLSRPCCYVFPAGRGVCAFFAVNGFTMLVDGGSESQSCFWKLVRHLDRVDAVLLTHAGTENLPGVNALLDRKVAELDMGLEVKGDLAKRLISPELGVVFFNAPSRLLMELQPYSDSVLRSRDQAARTIQLLKKLNVLPQPLFRPRGASIEPLTLFQKMGVGRLELYVLNPAKQSQDYQTLMQDWPDASTTQTQSQTQTQSLPSSLPVTSLASVCALLVWHPACPQEKVVRVLFPGATPQGKLLDGLERLNGLAFLQRPTVTAEDLKGWGEEMGPRRTESQDSGRSVGKETTTKSGSGRERGNIEEGKKEGTVKEKSKVINRNGQREEGKKEGDKIRLREVGVKQRAVAPDKASAKKGQREVKKEERTTSTGKREENGPKRKEPLKKESLPSKPKNGNKSQAKKEVRNDVKTGGKKTSKPSGKEIKTEANLDAKKTHGRTGPLKNHSANANTGSVTESVATETTDKEEENPMMDKESEENPSGSKMSTPEDMTAEFLRLGQETKREETQEELLDEGEKTGEARNEGSDRGEVEEKDGVSPEITEGGRAGQRTEDGDRKRDENGERTGTRERADGETGAETGDQDETLDGQEILFYNDTTDHPVKAVGFPSPLTKTPKSERSVHLDLTPTEYTLLDGALRESPSSRPSPEDQCPPSAEEETVDSASPQSRANSAGHTPYGLSPDDVWVCRENYNSKMSGLGTTDNQPLGSYRQCEGQPCGPKSTLESHTHTSTSRDKHLSFLSLGPLKEGLPDVSPSVTTTTTHSLPAEVSSPQSTEVDESLSMSFEQGPITASQREGENSDHQSNSNGNHFVDSDFRVGMTLSLKKPHRALVAEGSEMGHPPGPNTLHFESPPHDVDLCLVSPCEFKHFKPPGSSPQEPQLLANPPSSGSVKASLHDLSDDSDHSQEVDGRHVSKNRDTSASESNAHPGTEDCPSTTADGALDSDDEESYSDQANSLHDPLTHHTLPQDPPPALLKDAPPLPPQPGSCMPIPYPDTEAHGKSAKAAGIRAKKMQGASEVSQRPGSAGGPTQTGRPRMGGQSGVTRGVRSSTSLDTHSAPRTFFSSLKTGGKAGSVGDVSVYVDLAYLPSDPASPTVDVEFFRRIRSSCYIISGDSPNREGLMRRMLDALLEGKASWSDAVQVTVIPTYESAAMQEWYQQTLDRQRELDISVLGSNSTVAMQDETFPACKIEF